ncbi:alpha-2-glucosyltransferase Alg10 [Protomyces lactucae-debilis]|uniref:Dol-P-Glc:Glc(2)Man(9)GlcNAc(2)-PP-Dol alpha-1,2-glucosyltransferase n=1 Tax=Protomyces lactucae-debilis TaxID=2754530 RepID=A0A1Y2FFM8_PROLT|nr:alpha-2-glucosyltransferase Alg10 [Protomyces lactucae-debilis]ORY82712.1 alpha-2-glucosyltransferase Alg10 [Protomyces lactucae-debilis]
MNARTGLSSIYLAVQCLSLYLMHSAAPLPYMDEIFHVSQAQQYCAGNYKDYDPKLTTPPGLYLLSSLLHMLGLPCSLIFLRLQNLVLGLCALPMLCNLLALSSPPNKSSWAYVSSTMPLFSFFSLLYYTDILSTCLVLGTFVLLQRDAVKSAAIVGFASLWVRQTNLIWVFAFVVHQALVAQKTSRMTLAARLVERTIAVLWQPVKIGRRYAAFIPIGGFTTWFMWWNKSVVLDRSNHVAGFHPVQMLWMMTFCIGMNWPLFCTWHSFEVCKRRFKRPIYLMTITLACYVAVRLTQPHPFILADNRHYTFYVNRWILQRLAQPFQAVAFTVSTILWFDSLALMDEVTASMIVAASFVSLVPSPLLEFRYYMIPNVIWCSLVIHQATSLRKQVLFGWFMIVHVGAVGLFVMKPFVWASEPDAAQHFMW